ncbi:hypothetical protein BDZ89DRAFT_1073614 [Hymenopellis radicata]|nr:hypothetical protein BDZ89DRAFT_1073614 [Hymenopellis radicata]
MPGIPLEIKTLIIRELSPYGNPRYTLFCLVWPNTIAIIRKILFEEISIHASLRNLCQALENDPGLSTFVKTLEFSHRNPNGFRSLFLSFLSFIPKMHNLIFLRLDHMDFHDETSIAFNDFRILRESSVTHLALCNSTFSIPAFNAFLGYWRGRELDLSMLLEIDEDAWNWDERNTWTEWEVEKPRTQSFAYATTLQLKLSNSLECGMLMLMDFLASYEWSPLDCVYDLVIFSDDAITATTVKRINDLIRRYEPVSYLRLNFFSNEFEDAIGTPLIRKDFTLFERDEDQFKWYVESLTAVLPNSNLREFTLELHVRVPLKVRDLGSQGVWGRLDSALSGDNLELETLIIDTPGLAQLQTWLMEICFPEVTAKYFRCNKEERKEGR